jgi:acyl carrier protein
MMLDEVQNKILEVMSHHVPKQHRDGDGWMTLNLQELGIDSLTMTEIVFDLEEALGIEIEAGAVDAQLTKMKAVEARDALATHVLSLLTAKAA